MTSPVVGTNFSGPCLETWDPIYTCPLPVGSEAVSGDARFAAIDVLWSLSGRQFGVCSKTLRPCRRECYGATWPAGWSRYGSSGSWGWPFPALVGGQWFNLACSACGEGCSCTSVSEAILPGPINAVTEVKVDGVVLTPNTDYRIDDFRKLIRLGGFEWPICNNLNLADTEVGTWSVTISAGVPLPNLGRLALGELTAEFAKALMCDTSCKLPKPVQSISRQGVNVTFLDPNELLGVGQIGLYMVDLFINTYNPRKLQRRAKVYDIDNDNRRLTNHPIVP